MSRLLVYTTDPESGAAKVHTTEMAMTKTPLGHSVGMLMVQKSLEPDPQEVPGMVGAKTDTGSWMQKDGLTWVTFGKAFSCVRLLLMEHAEIPAGLDTKLDHFADTLSTSPIHLYLTFLAYTILTHGELDVDLIDGSTQKLMQGDVFVNAASVHRWVNRGTEPASEFASTCEG